MPSLDQAPRIWYTIYTASLTDGETYLIRLLSDPYYPLKASYTAADNSFIISPTFETKYKYEIQQISDYYGFP
jgi:hypothetical protein